MIPNKEILLDSIKEIYQRRENFILIGLTGRTGSGCSTTASLLAKKIEDLELPNPSGSGGCNTKKLSFSSR